MKKKYKILIYPLTLIIFGLILTYCCMVCKEEGTGTSDINVYDTVTVSGNSVPIDSTATVYKFSSGLELIVPPGAVTENVTVSFELLDSIRAGQIIPLDVFAGRIFCVGLYCEPTIIHFQKPIRIVVPASNYRHMDLPSVYLYNSGSQLWDQYYDTLQCSEEKHFIEFSTEDLYPARIELIRDAFSLTKTSEGKGETQDKICERGLVGIVSSSHDAIGSFKSGDCTVVSNNIEATFLECKDKPVSKDYVHEISEKCKPDVVANPSTICLRNQNDAATITFTAKIKGLPLEHGKITVALPTGLHSEPDQTINVIYTNAAGEANLTIKSDQDNFAGTIKWTAVIDYFLRVQEVSNSAGSVNQHEYPKTYEDGGSIDIRCTRFSISLDQPPYFQMDVGGNTRALIAACSPSVPNDLEYFVYGGYPDTDVVTVDSKTGVVTAKKPGVAYLGARSKSQNVVSNIIGLSVSYQGSLVLNKTIDWNKYDSGCCCDLEGIDPNTGWPRKNCWIMTYEGNLHFKFYLDIDKSNKAFGELDKGCESVDYHITEPSNCRSEKFYFYKNSGYDYWVTHETTDAIMNGTSFSLTIEYNYWHSAPNDCAQNPGETPLFDLITLYCHMSSGGVIIDRISYIPEGCVDKVNGTGLLN